MRVRANPIFLMLTAATAGCGTGTLEPISALPRELSVAETKLVATSNRFAFNLFREVVRQSHPDTNVFISPLSAAMALGMTYNGARGETRTAMAEALGLADLSVQEANESFRSLIDLLRGLDAKVDFRLANSIWYRLGFVPRAEFLDVNRRYFDAAVSALDFATPAAVGTINGWVEDNTGGRIPKIIDSIDPEIVMFLINAIYFKGDWIHQFDKSLTKSEPFHARGGGEHMASMMRHKNAVDVGRYRGAGFEAADLRYGRGAFSMTIVLPDSGRDVDSVAASLSAGAWQGVAEGLTRGSTIVEMPKFRLRWGDMLNRVLDSLGMGIAFQPYVADLSGIAGAPGDLYISYVKQGTFVDVNEEGTDAAAATAVAVGITSAGPPVFRVDRPFLFAIRERFSGTILFMGRIVNPVITGS